MKDRFLSSQQDNLKLNQSVNHDDQVGQVKKIEKEK